MEKEPLYQTSYIMDENRFIDFCRSMYARSSKKTFWTLNIVYGIVLAASIVGLVLTGDWYFIWLIVLFGGLLLWYDFEPENKKYKKLYSKDKSAHDEKVDFEFFENDFIIKSEYGESRIPYEKLYQIKESGNVLLILLSPGKGFPLYKNEISPELYSFLLKKGEELPKE